MEHMWQKIKNSDWIYISIFFLLFLFAFRKFWSAGMLAYGDTPPFPQTFREAFEHFFFAWHPIAHGINQPQPLTELYRGIFLFLEFNRADLTQHLFYFAPFLFAFVSAYFFLKPFVKSRPAKFLAAFFYAVNPVSIGSFIGGATGQIYVHALFPWVAFALWRLSQPGKRSLKFLNYTLSFALTMSFGGYLPFLLSPVGIFLLFKKLFRREIKDSFVFLVLALAGVIAAIILQFPFTAYGLPLLINFFAPAQGGGTPLNINVLIRDLFSTYGQNQLINLGLGGTYTGIENLKWAFPYTFIPVAFAFLSLAAITAKNKRVVLTFSVASLVLISFLYLTYFGKTAIVFRLFPDLLTFRNPAKPTLLLAFGYLPLLALSSEWLIEKLKSKTLFVSLVASLAIVVLTISLALQGFPFFVGDLTLKLSRGGFSSNTIPRGYYEISDWINQQRKTDPFFRTQWFPWTYEGQELKIRWLDPSTFSLPMGFENFTYSGIKGYTYLVVGSAAFDEKTTHLGKWLGYADIKYLILNKALKRGFADSGGEPQSFLDLWEKQADLTKVKEDGNFVAYENKEYVPPVETYSNVYLINKLGATDSEGYPLEILKKVSGFNSFSPKGDLLVFEDQLDREQIKFLSENKEKKFIENGRELKTEDFNSQPSLAKLLEVKKLNPSHYRLTIEADSPQFVVLGEPYNALWQGKVEGKNLFHFNAFYRNGYYLDKTGKNTIEIEYLGQKKLNLLLAIWLVAWLSLIISLWMTLRRKKKIQ